MQYKIILAGNPYWKFIQCGSTLQNCELDIAYGAQPQCNALQKFEINFSYPHKLELLLRSLARLRLARSAIMTSQAD